MKKLIMVLLFAGTLNQISAQQKTDSMSIHPVIQNTALLTPEKCISKGLWEPYAYGLNPRVELQSYLLLNATMPNFGARVQYHKSKSGKFILTGNHYISYFSLWLKFWQGEGTGAIITPELNIPTKILIQNGITGSYIFGPAMLFSAGVEFSFCTGRKIGNLYTVDMPLVYQRFAPAFTGPVIAFKTNVQGRVFRKFQYLAHANLFQLTGNISSVFAEGGVMAVYAPGRKWKIAAGTILTYGKYPFGKQLNIIPNINVYCQLGRLRKQ